MVSVEQLHNTHHQTVVHTRVKFLRNFVYNPVMDSIALKNQVSLINLSTNVRSVLYTDY